MSRNWMTERNVPTAHSSTNRLIQTRHRAELVIGQRDSRTGDANLANAGGIRIHIPSDRGWHALNLGNILIGERDQAVQRQCHAGSYALARWRFVHVNARRARQMCVRDTLSLTQWAKQDCWVGRAEYADCRHLQDSREMEQHGIDSVIRGRARRHLRRLHDIQFAAEISPAPQFSDDRVRRRRVSWSPKKDDFQAGKKHRVQQALPFVRPQQALGTESGTGMADSDEWRRRYGSRR